MNDDISAIVCAALVFSFFVLTFRSYLLRFQVSGFHKSSFSKAHGCAPPQSLYPHNPFLLRLDLFLEVQNDILSHRFTEGVRRRFNKYGPTWVAQLAYRNLVCTVDPENLQTVMSTNSNDWTIIPPRQKLVRLMFGDGAFSTVGDEWRHSRSIIRKAMRGLDLNVPMLEKYAGNVVQQARKDKGETIDLGKLINEYTMSASADIILGADDSEAREDFEQDFATLSSMAKQMTIFVRAIPFLGQMMFGFSFTETRKRVYAYASRLVGMSGLSIRQRAEPLIHGLAREEADPVRVRSEALNMMLAGRDVGIALTELFYLLARHPDVWARLRQEVKTVSLEDINQLHQMTYLSHVINEGLRLRPPLAVHGRRAICDTVLPRGGGPDGTQPISIAAGTFVLYSNYSLHRNPSVFGEDIDAFRPERWETIAPARWEYLAWGSGPRHCPGKKMGWTMIAYFTARLVEEFERIEKVGSDAWEEERSFSSTNRFGTKVRFES